MQFKPFAFNTKHSIPTWMIIVSAIVFFPFGILLLFLRLKANAKNNLLAGKLLLGAGIFWAFASIVITVQCLSGSLKTAEGVTYPVGGFLLITALLLALAKLYLSCGYQLLQHTKHLNSSVILESPVSSTSTPSASCTQPFICPSCGASNQIQALTHAKCDYCGTLLHS